MHILEKQGLNPSALGLLMFIKLNTTDGYVRDVIRSSMYEFKGEESGKTPAEILEEAGYIKYIKGKKSDQDWEKVRLSELGEKILKELNHKPLHELANFTMLYIKQEYERVGAKKLVKGGEKIQHYISEFLHEKENYNERMIKAVITAYVNSFEYDSKYMNGMGTLFFKPTNAYATKWKPEDCPIWDFIEKNQSSIKNVYTKL